MSVTDKKARDLYWNGQKWVPADAEGNFSTSGDGYTLAFSSKWESDEGCGHRVI